MTGKQDYSIDGARFFKQVSSLLRPHQVKGVEKVRIGHYFDGGYIMLDKLDGTEAAYSLGINDEVSWDIDMALRGVEIFQYDHTIESPPHAHPLIHWKKIGIAGSPDLGRSLDTLEHLVETNGHQKNNNLVLKCDIEGAEWDMLMFTPNRVIRQFSQIVMEIHDLHHVKDYGPADAVRKSLGNLHASHRVVHVHANNYAGMSIVGGYPVPHVLEVTFARLDLGEFSPSNETFPTPMDTPCDKDSADIYLGRFDFA